MNIVAGKEEVLEISQVAQFLGDGAFMNGEV